MRLSDIKGERAIDVIADLIAPITILATDKEIKTMFFVKPAKKDKSGKVDIETVKKKLMTNIQTKLPSLLKQHKNEIFAVLSVLEGVSFEKYVETVKLPKLVKDIIECATDPELQSLFTSAGQMENLEEAEAE